MGPPYPRVLSFSLVRKSSIQMPDTTQDQSHLTRSGLFHPKWIIGMNFQRLLPTLDSRVRVPRSFRPPWRCLRHHLRFWLGVMVNMLALDVFLLLRWWSLCWLDSYMNLTFDRLLFMWMTERLVQMKCYGLNYGDGSAKMLEIWDKFIVYDSFEMDLKILIHTYISLNVSHQTWLAIMNYN